MKKFSRNTLANGFMFVGKVIGTITVSPVYIAIGVVKGIVEINRDVRNEKGSKKAKINPEDVIIEN